MLNKNLQKQARPHNTYVYEKNLRDSVLCDYKAATSAYKDLLNNYNERRIAVDKAVKSL